MSRDYNCTIAVKANPTQTFHAICDIPKWWATNFEGRAQIAGDRFTVRFGKTYSVIKVSESDPGKKLTWIIEKSYLPLFKNRRSGTTRESFGRSWIRMIPRSP